MEHPIPTARGIRCGLCQITLATSSLIVYSDCVLAVPARWALNTYNVTFVGRERDGQWQITSSQTYFINTAVEREVQERWRNLTQALQHRGRQTCLVAVGSIWSWPTTRSTVHRSTSPIKLPPLHHVNWMTVVKSRLGDRRAVKVDLVRSVSSSSSSSSSSGWSDQWSAYGLAGLMTAAMYQTGSERSLFTLSAERSTLWVSILISLTLGRSLHWPTSEEILV